MSIELRTCDDWIAVYRDGQKVWESHSCPLRQGLEALGIEFTERDLDAEGLDVDTLRLPSGEDAFPERLPS